MRHFDAKTEKLEKGAQTPQVVPLAQKASKTKGFVRVFLVPEFNFSLFSTFGLRNAKYRKRHQKSLKCIKLQIFSFRGQMAPKRAKKPLRL